MICIGQSTDVGHNTVDVKTPMDAIYTSAAPYRLTLNFAVSLASNMYPESSRQQNVSKEVPRAG